MPARKIENTETVVIQPTITDIGPDGAGPWTEPVRYEPAIGPDGAGPFELALQIEYEPVIVERLGGQVARLYLVHNTPTWVYAPSEPPAGAVALYREVTR